ncbi:unnamed protein product [Brassicogethes aeneus]|uniref:Nuclear-export cofactor Arc1-like N-terminal domain-containing protein n=1 Tax=Brassicogethes aeneus TaxID=1431903 RepID=A0A9P0AZ29_BRAAE|nr:unnamed protein product [Brassicogethes aeneus]
MSATTPFLQKVSKLLKVPISNIIQAPGLVISCTINGKTFSGTLNIISTLLTASKSNLAGKDDLEKLQIYQWIEYAMVYAVQCNSVHNIQQILTELNSVLAERTFIASYGNITIADVLLYYILHGLMESLVYLEKEKFIHVSRWFNNIQQDSNIRQNNKIIDFRSNFLVNLAPARHF